MILAVPEIDSDRVLREARELSYPRYPGTEGDRRAIGQVAEALRSTGLGVEVEEFSYDLRHAFRALRSLLLGVALLVAGAGLAAQSRPWAAALVLLAAPRPRAVSSWGGRPGSSVSTATGARPRPPTSRPGDPPWSPDVSP